MDGGMRQAKRKSCVSTASVGVIKVPSRPQHWEVSKHSQTHTPAKTSEKTLSRQDNRNPLMVFQNSIESQTSSGPGG